MDIELHLANARSTTCVVTFAAGSQRQYNFGRTLTRLGIPHVLMRDSAGAWYQNGVDGVGDREETAHYIRQLGRSYRVKTLGISSGSYAALLYGYLAGADDIIAISPVSGAEIYDLDPKWHHRVLPKPGEVFVIDDLRKYYLNGTRSRVQTFVSDGDGAEIDAHMARRIGSEPTLIPGHAHGDLARVMRDSGLLEKVLLE